MKVDNSLWLLAFGHWQLATGKRPEGPTSKQPWATPLGINGDKIKNVPQGQKQYNRTLLLPFQGGKNGPAFVAQGVALSYGLLPFQGGAGPFFVHALFPTSLTIPNSIAKAMRNAAHEGKPRAVGSTPTSKATVPTVSA